MKLPAIVLSLFLLSVFAFAAGKEEAPEAINAHYSWCEEGKNVAEKLKRYEEFWEKRVPAQPDAYDDHPHVTYVRRCAYRLAELYAQTGQTKKCVAKLKWLETNDEMFPENAKEAEPAK